MTRLAERGHIWRVGEDRFLCGWQPPDGWRSDPARHRPCPDCIAAARFRQDHPATRNSSDRPRGIGWPLPLASRSGAGTG